MHARVLKLLQAETLSYLGKASNHCRLFVASHHAGRHQTPLGKWSFTGLMHPANARFQSWQCRAASAASAQTVVLVESPAKAKKIQQFLGPGYQVEHVL